MNRQNKWRKKNIAYRNAMRKANYRKTRVPDHKRKWTDLEIGLILDQVYLDSTLAKKLGRSVQAIQTKRWKEKAKLCL